MLWTVPQVVVVASYPGKCQIASMASTKYFTDEELPALSRFFPEL